MIDHRHQIHWAIDDALALHGPTVYTILSDHPDDRSETGNNGSIPVWPRRMMLKGCWGS
jgi:hypothetical protein